MVYKVDIPKATDVMSASQVDLLENFTVIDRWVNVNHRTFDGGANEGKHKFVTFMRKDVTTTTPNMVQLFAKLYSGTGGSELFFRRQNDGEKYQFTARNSTSTGYAIFPSGILMKWNSVIVGAEPRLDSADINISVTNGPAFNNVSFAYCVAYQSVAPDPNFFAAVREFDRTTITARIVSTNALGGWNGGRVIGIAVGQVADGEF